MEARKTFAKALRKFLTIFVWIYFPIKAFVFDIDIFLLREIAPDYLWLINLRFFFFFSIFFIFWLIFGFKEFVLTVAYLFVFPLIFFIGKPIVFLYKNAEILIYFIGKNIVNFLIISGTFISNIKKYFKLRVLFTLLFFTSCIIIFIDNNQKLTIVAICYLLFFLGVHFISRIYIAFAPSTLFQKINDFLNGASFNIKKKALEKRAEANFKNPYENKELEQIVIFSYLISYFRTIFRDILESPRLIAYYLFSLLYTFSITVLVLGFIHLGLYNLNPADYAIKADPNLGLFIYLGLNSIINVNITQITAIGKLSQYILTLGGLIGYLVGIVYIFLLLGILVKRYNYTISKIISSLEREEKNISYSIQKEYNLSFDEATQQVKEKDENHAKVINLILTKINRC